MSHLSARTTDIMPVFLVVGSVSQAEIAKHLEYGREFLAKGQLQDALSHYHAAVGTLNREFAPGF